MRGGTLLILGHGVKGEGQLWHSVYNTLWTRYRLQFKPNHFQTSHVTCGGGTLLILGHGVIGQGQLPPPPPSARGCRALRYLVFILL